MQKLHIIHQYVKSLSFESPDSPGIFVDPKKEKPDVEVSIDIDARKLEGSNYEVTLKFNSAATIGKDSTLFDLELIYGGVFKIEEVEENMIEQVLLIYCPNMLFPFIRRIVANMTSDAGVTPLMINPIDFTALYNKRVKEKVDKSTKKPEKSKS